MKFKNWMAEQHLSTVNRVRFKIAKQEIKLLCMKMRGSKFKDDEGLLDWHLPFVSFIVGIISIGFCKF